MPKQEFSTAFTIVEDELEDAERRLNQRRAKKGTPNTESKPGDDQVTNVNEQPILTIPKNREPSPKRASRKKPAKPTEAGPSATPYVVKKVQRQNLNLKATLENAERFDNLYHRLRLKGDDRKKQDLLDEALKLLFAKYDSLAD